MSQIKHVVNLTGPSAEGASEAISQLNLKEFLDLLVVGKGGENLSTYDL